MSNITITDGERPQASQLNTFTNAGNDQLNNQSLISYERKNIEGTPFWIVGNNEEGFIITMGKHRITKKTYPTSKECEDALETIDKWDIIFNMCIAIFLMNENSKLRDNGE